MAKIIKFSEISNHFVNDGSDKYCLADTNFLIATIHDEHTFYTPTNKFLEASKNLGWVDFCEAFVASNLTASWEDLLKTGLNYFDIRKEELELGESSCLINKKILWEDMVSLVGKTAMGTADAMIANAFLASKFDVLVTTDFDLAYGLAVNIDDSKIVAIPDAMLAKNKPLLEKIKTKRKKT